MDWHQYIEAYHLGTLQEPLKEGFEQALQEDSELRELVDNFELIEPVLDLMVEEEIRGQMTAIRNSVGKPSSSSQIVKTATKSAGTSSSDTVAKVRPLWTNLKVVAGSAVTVAILAIFFFTRSSPTTHSEGWDMMAQKFELSITNSERSLNDSNNTTTLKPYHRNYWLMRQMLIETKSDSAIYYLNEMRSLPEQDPGEVTFYSILAHYLDQDYAEVEKLLIPILEDESHPYHKMGLQFEEIYKKVEK